MKIHLTAEDGTDCGWVDSDNVTVSDGDNVTVTNVRIAMDEVDDTLHAKENTHGPYRDQAQFAQLMKGLLHRHVNWNDLPAEQKETLDMIMVKLSRIMHGNSAEPDHWLDISGYAMLCYNLLTTGSHLK